METVTVLLMLVAVATAYPYSPYTDHKEESKNVQLSEEAVAAYLKGKMEKENLEPVKIMDYVEALLQGGKKGTQTESPSLSRFFDCCIDAQFSVPAITHCMHQKITLAQNSFIKQSKKNLTSLIMPLS